MKQVKLTPDDKNQCQAEILQGSFMTLGPRHYKRCENKPTCIATERKPNKEDGRIGQMSLCGNCRKMLVKQKGTRYARFEAIKP